MGPADISDMSTTSTNNNALTVPKLRADSSNWATYQERIMNYLASKSLKRHVLGTARKPTEPEKKKDEEGKEIPLTNEEQDKFEDELEAYEQKQASVREVIYRTVDRSTFLQIKNEVNAQAVWKKLVSIHANKGNLYETNLLTQLQNTRYTEGGDMREHLTKMVEIKERLAEMGCPITDESLTSYIRTSVSLVPTFRTLFTSLSATAHQSGTKLTSTNLIWHLTEEANAIAIEDNINKSNAAMMAIEKGKGGKRGKGKVNPKREERKCSNPNCGKTGHVKEQCFAKGGGKEKEAPDWYKALERKHNEKGTTSANAAEMLRATTKTSR